MNQSRLLRLGALVVLIALFFVPFDLGTTQPAPSIREAPLPDSYRSSSGVHKLIVLDRDGSARERLVSEGTVLRTIDYGGFALLFVNDATMDLLTEPSLKPVRVRDDFDLIGLNGWTIDTRLGCPVIERQSRDL